MNRWWKNLTALSAIKRGTAVALALWALGTAGPAAAAEPGGDPERTAAALMTPATDKAIDHGLAWLAAQQHDNGGVGSGTYFENTAVTGLAGMALMAGGSTPGRGPYGRQVNRCVDYLIASAQQSGFISMPRGAGHGPMYGHGFATLFLAECYGMSPRPELRETLAKAVKLIENTQNGEGGWRYFPQRADVADISVTICQMMALRAARNAGIAVPKETVDRGLEYVKRCQNPDGGFRYMLSGGDRESMFPRSAAGVVALNSAGLYEGPEIRKGLDYLMQFLPRPGLVIRADTYHDYGHYYAAQAMWQAGGQRWARWYPAVRDDIIARQRDDGSWPSYVSGEASAAMYLMVLELPNNLLPIFQR